MNEIDIAVAVIGGGVVGLACALALAESGASVCVVERESRPGRGMSTHNSGVIHAGIYYPPGSLKARLCLEGRDRLYAFCERHSVPHQRCGKLLVASHESEIAELEALAGAGHRERRDIARDGRRRTSCGGRSLMYARPPRLWSPDTGIVEAEALITALGRLCRDLDVAMVVGTAIVDAGPANGGVELVTPHERFLAKNRRQCRRAACRRSLRDARRKTISHQAVPGRIRRAAPHRSAAG